MARAPSIHISFGVTQTSKENVCKTFPKGQCRSTNKQALTPRETRGDLTMAWTAISSEPRHLFEKHGTCKTCDEASSRRPQLMLRTKCPFVATLEGVSHLWLNLLSFWWLLIFAWGQLVPHNAHLDGAMVAVSDLNFIPHSGKASGWLGRLARFPCFVSINTRTCL